MYYHPEEIPLLNLFCHYELKRLYLMAFGNAITGWTAKQSTGYKVGLGRMT